MQDIVMQVGAKARRARGRNAGPAKASSGLAAILEEHRRRFVAPLRAGKDCHEIGQRRARDAKAEIVLSLAAAPAGDVLARLPACLEILDRGGTLVIAATGDVQALAEAMGRAFPVVARYRQRSLAGSIIVEERFASVRVTVLADRGAADSADCVLFVGASAPPPSLAGGVFEAADGAAEFIPLADTGAPAPHPEPAARDDLYVPRSVAASLVDRLRSLDERHLADYLATEAARGERGADAGRNAAAAPFDLADADHPWPLRDNPTLRPETLEKYDRRVDDDVVGAARDGARFLETFALLGPTPDFAGAVAALNAADRRLRLDSETPDASIVIPVHGQFAYTLNCLDALFAHASQYSAEIIIVDDGSTDATPEFLPNIPGIRAHRQPVNAGFIASANAGAARARGRFVVMLNNDTRVMPGWLDMLIGGFELFPRAGMVGSKLLYPDGTLQEAGGIIWRNGVGWNYGRGDDPNRPRYCHARQVDYVSGASIAIPAEIWRALGGFDVYFAPAYYEDADLCFRLRAAGYETWLQPGSRVIHYEGKTGGTDLRHGAKSYQTRNAGKFLIRHRETLLAHRPHGEAILLERERHARRRALVIEPTCPTPKQDAGSGYTIMVMQLLQTLGYKPYFVPEDNFLYQPEHTAALHHLGIECAFAPYDLGFENYARRHGALFDIIIAFRAPTFARIVDILRAAIPHAPIIFNNHDLRYLRMQRAAELTGDADALARAETAKRGELAVMARADCILSPSPFEVELISREIPEIPAIALPLMTPLFGTTAGFARRRDVCFLGGYRHEPNVDAVAYFVREVLPLIQAEEPSIRFIIAGANPGEQVRALARADVIVTGMIDDLRDVLDAARVFVCPLRFGAGMKGKLLTALSYGLPVVTTTIGVEGIAAVDGEHVLVADTPADLAAACLRLYRNESLWASLSANGQSLMREKYSLASGQDALRRAIDIAMHQLHGIETPAA